MTPEITASSPTMPVANMAFLLNLRLGTLSNSKKVPSTAVKVVREFDFDPDTDPEMIRVSKKLLECPELQEIKAYHHAIRDYVEARELPTKGQFRAGMYLMSYKFLAQIEDRLTLAEEQINELVDRLILALDQRIEESAQRLGVLFNPGDYPSEKTIRERLKIQYEYQTLATPDGLKQFKGDIYKREQEKLQRRMQEALEDSRALIAGQTRDLLAAVAERLTPDVSGKPKMMRKDMVSNWTEMLDMLADKNVTGDSDLAAVIAEAKAKFEGRDSVTMKGDAALRTEIAKTFNELVARLDDQVINRPLRQISFEEAT